MGRGGSAKAHRGRMVPPPLPPEKGGERRRVGGKAHCFVVGPEGGLGGKKQIRLPWGGEVPRRVIT